MLGVSIEDAWSQPNLLNNQQTAAKVSKYTVPVEPQMIQQQRPQFVQSGMLEQFGNSDRPPYNSYAPQVPMSQAIPVMPADYAQASYAQQASRPEYTNLPISNPVYTQQVLGTHQADKHQMQVAEPPSEIPRLKEQLTQQINTVSECQREVVFLKSFIQQLKKEINDITERHNHYVRTERRKKWQRACWVGLFLLLLIVITVLVVQMLQKINRLLAQPVLFGQ
jgi:hypothetical protein